MIRKRKRRITAILLMVSMLFSLIDPSMAAGAAEEGSVQLLNVNEGSDGNTATLATAPDGQTAWSLNTGTSKAGGPWDNLFTPSVAPKKDLSSYKDGYFVFEMYIPNESFKKMTGNNWLVIVSDSNPSGDKFNTDSRLQLDLSGVTNAAAGTWATVYVKLSSASTVAGNFNDAWLDQVTRLAMHLQWDTSVPPTGVFIKNPRLQKSILGTPASPSVVPSFDIATKTATANAPATGQSVEFAISEDGTVPASGWAEGIIKGGSYSYTFDQLPLSDTFYVFTRATASLDYPFTGASSRITVTTIGDQALVDAASESLTWDTIKGANTSKDDVKSQLSLLTAIGTTNVSWSSNNQAAINSSGTVNRLFDRENEKQITLTATVTKGSASATKDIIVMVKAAPAAENACTAEYFPNSNEGTVTAAPDGNIALKLGAGRIGAGAERIWDTRFTSSSGNQDLISYANQYFVFDMYVTHADLLNLSGNNWLAMAVGGNNIDTNSRLNLNVSDIRNAKANEWITVYAQLSTSNSPNNFNPANLDTTEAGRLQMQWASNPQGDIYIKNPRFQNSNVSARPVPAIVSTNGTSIIVSAAAPSNGQAVEFAVNTTGSAPAESDWVTGALKEGIYTASLSKTATDEYYIFARATKNVQYPFAGTHTRVKVVYLNDSQSVADAAAKLTWDSIRGMNTLQTEVRTDLNLPTAGANDTVIKWSVAAEAEGIISPATGKVTRDPAEDKDVTLTATISKGTAAPVKVNFNLTIAAKTNEQATVFIDFNDPATYEKTEKIGSGFGDGGDPLGPYPGLQGNGIGISLVGDSNTQVTENTPAQGGGVKGMKIGNYMYVIVDDSNLKRTNKVELEVTYWRPSATNGISLQYNTIYAGNISGLEAYRSASIPATGSGSNWVTSKTTLSGANFAIGAQNQGAHIRFSTADAIIRSIRITEISPTNEEAVQLASDSLTWDAIKGTNAKQDLVETDLTLSKIGWYRTNIDWTSTDDTVIDSDTGKVTRKELNANVTLKAIISKGSVQPVEKTFNIVVRGTGTGTDENAVDNTLSKLTWDFIKGVNATEANGGMGNVTTNLVLPSMGENMTDISWDTSDAALMTATGIIPTSRPDNGGVVKLTATVKRGPVANPVVKTKTFTLTIPDRYDYAKHIRKAIDYKNSKDGAISDFNVLAFGAKTEAMAEAEGLSDFCNREAFQAAIDAAYSDGGGVVYIPAGTYAFRTEIASTISVQNANGNKTYEYKQVLNLRAGVQLRGEWDNPDAADYDGKIGGTILAVYAGKNSPNYDTYVDSDAREAQTGGKKVANVSDRFIAMEQGTGVTNLSVWYPEQDITAKTRVEKRGEDGQKTGEYEIINGIPYPWTFFQREGNSATLDNVTLVNAWGGFISLPSEMHYVLNSNMTALYKGIVVHTCTDIGRIENVNINPKYWADSGLPGAPKPADVKAYTRLNAVGFMMHRSDWEYVSGLHVAGYKMGMWIGREPGGDEAPNAQFYSLKTEDCGTGIYVDNVNNFGLLFSNSQFAGDKAVEVGERFNASIQFNGVQFAGPIVSNARGGVISFEDCTFDKGGSSYALNFLNKGTALVTQSNFIQQNKHVKLAEGFGTFKSVNSGYNLNINSDNLAAHLDSLPLDIDRGGTNTVVQIVNDPGYLFDPIPKDVKTDIDVHPKAATDVVLRLDFPRSLTGNVPTADISARLQDALNYVKENYGGGTVYLPGGRYRLNNPVTIPEGVELRGTWDVQHHTQGGGTAIFTSYTGGSQGKDGASLIQLKANAGIRGLSIAQLNLNVSSSPTEIPFLVQGQGAGVYVINLTIPIGDKGIDLASYKTDRHYVDYLGGTLLRAGIWVGGGAVGGFIRNMQFNPHYALRRPAGQGYPEPSGDLYAYVQGNCSALKFADVEDETIFNNFVYGSVYGIHFLKRDLGNGQYAYPGKITMIGHGSDGCTYALYVEDADENTKIMAINSELVNTNISTQPDRAYVRMGDAAGTAKIDANSELVLYNSAFWGSPTTAGALVNKGIVRFQQANFTQLPGNNPGIDVYGGKAYVFSSYFQPTKNGQNNNVYAMLRDEGTSIELSNNYYSSSLMTKAPDSNPYGIYGADLMAAPFVFNFNKTDVGYKLEFKYNVVGKKSAPGKMTISSPSKYAGIFSPITFDALATGQSVTVDLPKYVAGLITFEIRLDNGMVYTYTTKIDEAYAEKVSSNDGNNPAKNSSTPVFMMDTKDYVTMGTVDGPQDLSAEARYAWDDQNLYAYITVSDDVHNNSQTGGDIWKEDCLQFGVDLTNPATNSNTRNELGFALTNEGKTVVYAWARPTGNSAPAAPITDIKAKITRDEKAKTTTYDLTIPFNTVMKEPSAEIGKGRIGVSIMLNESDSPAESDGGRSTFEVESGQLKNSTLFTNLYLIKKGEYSEMVETAARAAVKWALETKTSADIAIARNYVSIMTEGQAKNELVALLGPEDSTPPTTPPTTPTTTPIPAPIPVITYNEDLSTVSTEVIATGETAQVDAATIAALCSNAVQKKAKVIEFNVNAPDGVKEVKVEFNRDAFKQLASSTKAGVKIDAKIASVAFDDKAVDSISSAATSGDIIVAVKEVDKSMLTAAARSKIGNHPVFNFTVTAGNKIISAFGSGKAECRIPYTLKSGENKNSIVVYYIDNSGKLITVNGRYDEATETVKFTVKHFSNYAIAYNKVNISDIDSNNSYYNAAEYLSARGVMNVTNGKFSPGKKLSKADFVMAVMKAYGIIPDTKITNNFSDAGNKYYSSYLATARRLGFIKGSSNNTFQPEAVITKKEMLVIINRVLKYQGEAAIGNPEILSAHGKKLNDKSSITRGDAAKLLYELLTK